MKMGDRLLSFLWLFSVERPIITAEEAAHGLSLSLSTTYRHLGKLCEVGLLESVGRSGYALGPAIIELDRKIRLADPLLQAAGPSLARLLRHVGPAATILLCRLYRGQVMCVEERRGERAAASLSYERGRPMPMFRGAPSKAILAHLPGRTAERLWSAEVGMGEIEPEAWPKVRDQLREIRRNGVSVAQGEVDPGAVGVAACIFELGRPLGSVCVVIPSSLATAPNLAQISALSRASADEITATLVANEGPADLRHDALAEPAALAFNE